jgi:hypothetical protein
MHKEILNKKQLELLPIFKNFTKDFVLVGGTAVALHLGHRRSIDFDLFTLKEINRFKIQKKIMNFTKIQSVFVDNKDEYTVLLDGVKITFLYYPFEINKQESIGSNINLADLETLAALKAYALGRRSKWKDYVDLYFILKSNISLKQIIRKSNSIFKSNFNEKIFRVQLAYFKDIDYSEQVDYMPNFKVSDKKIKEELTKISLQE